jgi:sugar/nucleoside kinase (ribokinase family)
MAEGPKGPGLDVLGLGNAIVDVVAHAEDAELAALGLAKGTMTLVDAKESAALYGRMGPAVELSGGSCANTMAALASMGSRAAYVGRVRDDQLGQVFAHDVRAAGVSFSCRPAADGPPTARCLVFVTPDAQRTMATYLGACVELGPEDVDEALVEAAAITYLEGYLWDRPSAKAACRKAIGIARRRGRRIALTLSDPFCVGRWRDEFLALIAEGVDVLFANEAEISELLGVADLEAAVPRVQGLCPLAALTRGARGSVVVAGERVVEIAAAPLERLLDSTGAGDLYAAGFLHGLSRGRALEDCGRLASRAAAHIMGQYGARPDRPLAGLIDAG